MTPPTVGGQGYRLDRASVAGKCAELLAGLQVPDRDSWETGNYSGLLWIPSMLRSWEGGRR